jgi:hypothetical protein
LIPVGIPRPPYLVLVILVRQQVSILAFILFNTLYIGGCQRDRFLAFVLVTAR